MNVTSCSDVSSKNLVRTSKPCFKLQQPLRRLDFTVFDEEVQEEKEYSDDFLTIEDLSGPPNLEARSSFQGSRFLKNNQLVQLQISGFNMCMIESKSVTLVQKDKETD